MHAEAKGIGPLIGVVPQVVKQYAVLISIRLFPLAYKTRKSPPDKQSYGRLAKHVQTIVGLLRKCTTAKIASDPNTNMHKEKTSI